MKRLIVMLIIVASSASSVMAQQSGQSPNQLAEVKARLSNASSATTPAPDYFRIQRSDNAISRLGLEVITEDAVKIEAPVYVKDGKVYIAFGSSGLMIPMTSGGAGLCFGVDMKARIEALKNLIIRFPR